MTSIRSKPSGWDRLEDTSSASRRSLYETTPGVYLYSPVRIVLARHSPYLLLIGKQDARLCVLFLLSLLVRAHRISPKVSRRARRLDSEGLRALTTHSAVFLTLITVQKHLSTASPDCDPKSARSDCGGSPFAEQ
jgi:hypothetical protein